jgi:hypothetical protein
MASAFVTVQVTPADLSFQRDTTYLMAEETDSLRLVVPSQSNRVVRGQVEFATSDPGIVSLDGSGVARGNRPGTATVRATIGGKDIKGIVTVLSRPASWALPASPDEAIRLPITARRNLNYKAVDAEGRVMYQVPVRWTSEDSAIAAFDPQTQQLVGKGIGSTTISATLLIQGARIKPPLTWKVEVTADVSRSSNDTTRPSKPRNVPTEALSFYSRALLYQDQDSLQKASDYYREALRIFPEYTEALAGLTRIEVRQRLNDWTKHLEGRNLAGLLQLYPEMPEKDQQAWRRLLANPSVTRISVVAQNVSVELTGPAEARIRYALAYSMTVRPSGLQSSVSRYEATFKLMRGAWLITSMQGQP